MTVINDQPPYAAEEAWLPYRPDVDGPWTTAEAAHLYRRAGFGAPLAVLREAAEKTPGQASQDLLTATEPESFRQLTAQLARAAVASGDPRSLAAWWMRRIISTPAQATERLVLFWHGHFATSAEKVTDVDLMLQQNELIRTHAMTEFEPFVQAMARDPAMLLWLDAATSRKAHPNENFARELMELFCLGEGRYTEADIREAARCFTGWEVRRRQFRFNRYQHDSDEKTVLGRTGLFDGQDIVRIVLEQSAAAEFLICKLVRYYFRDEIPDVAALCQPLIRQYRENSMRLQPVLQTMFSSRLFYSRWCQGFRVRSPVDLAVSLLRTFEGSANTVLLSQRTQEAGQGLFFPPGVQGWDEGRAWINTSTLLGRSNLISGLLTDSSTRFSGKAPAEYCREVLAEDPQQAIRELQTALFARSLPGATLGSATQLLRQRSDQSLLEALQLLCSIPEFQLS